MFTEHVQSRSVQREATRQKVLAAAEGRFREHGFGATTIRQIASDAEVSTGTVMAVGDKEALLVAIFEGWIAAESELGDVNRGGTRPVRGKSARIQAVLDVFVPFIDYFTRDRELWREYGAIIMRGKHESVIFQGLEQPLIAALVGALTQCGLTPAGARRGAQVLYFAYLGVLMTISNGAREVTEGIEQLGQVADFVISHKGEQ
ncbi:MAG: TetR/AcrR family transcriptional regulator [Mycobacterium sp.]